MASYQHLTLEAYEIVLIENIFNLNVARDIDHKGLCELLIFITHAQNLF